VHEIIDTIEARFDGDRVLLLADCCHSGALYDEVRSRRETEIAYAVFTSSYSHNTSTGNWTYSDCLLAALDGDPRVDLDNSGTINLRELAHYGELELAFVEGQKSMFLATREFPSRTRLAVADGEPTPRVGQRLEVEFDGRWYKAETIDADGDQLEVHYVHADDSTDEWVGPERVRPYQPAQFAEGDAVEVKWETDDQWYPARVLRAWYGLHMVRYDDYDRDSDEWVGPQSIRLRSE
ncbi:MAG: agenet domain-containing protein, partial [Singulisphaera sp.]